MKNSIFDLIAAEKRRQQATINLIASENYAHPDILAAMGCTLTNKYAEGYPKARYYGGCHVIDQIETIAIERAKKLFNAEHANVQPHSGSSANMAAYLSVLNPGDTVLGMNLHAGGHLTHGHPINFSGKIYNFVGYNVDRETELIDYQALACLADQHAPKVIVVGTSAYSQQIDYKQCARIAKQYGAMLLADIAHIAGLVATGLHPNPLPYADIVTTTTHKTLRGPRGGMILSSQTQQKNVDKAVMPGSQGGPLMHVIAAKGIAFKQALKPEFLQYQQKVINNAQIMADAFASLGYRIVSGGTTTHLFMIDLRSMNTTPPLNGAHAEHILEKCNIIVNRNMIPFDTAHPTQPSGIRIGTPAITTQGMGRNEVEHIVEWIDQALHRHDDEKFLQALKEKVRNTCDQFPIWENQKIIVAKEKK